MVEISFNERRRRVAERVDECTQAQYHRLLLLHLKYGWEGKDPEGLTMDLFSVLLNLSDLRIYHDYIVDEVMAQRDKLEGFFQDGGLKLGTCKNMLPEYHGWKGPGDMFNGLTFASWLEAYLAFSQGMKEGIDVKTRESLFETMTKALYHHDDKNLQPSAVLVTHCILHFAEVWHTIMNNPVNIAGEDLDFGIIFRKTDNGRAHFDDRTGWIGVAMEVAKDGPFGDLKGVNAADFWDVIIYLYKCKFEFLHRKTPKTS